MQEFVEIRPCPPARANAIDIAAKRLGAVPGDIPDLWWIPGRSDIPELTTNQLLDLASRT